jgi:DNA invertase Pin-like site-specific DNA recombinase
LGHGRVPQRLSVWIGLKGMEAGEGRERIGLMELLTFIWTQKTQEMLVYSPDRENFFDSISDLCQTF